MTRALVRVRSAEARDVDAIYTIAGSGSVAWSVESVESCLREPNSMLVAESRSGDIAGFVAFLIAADELQILNIAVSRDHRNKGIATQLLRASAEVAFGRGVQHCFLEVDTMNQPAISLYRKMGFNTTGKRPKFYATGNDAIMMQAPVKTLMAG